MICYMGFVFYHCQVLVGDVSVSSALYKRPFMLPNLKGYQHLPHITFWQCPGMFSSHISSFQMHYLCFLLHFTVGEDCILINPFAGSLPLQLPINPFHSFHAQSSHLPPLVSLQSNQSSIPSTPLKVLLQKLPGASG